MAAITKVVGETVKEGLTHAVDTAAASRREQATTARLLTREQDTTR